MADKEEIEWNSYARNKMMNMLRGVRKTTSRENYKLLIPYLDAAVENLKDEQYNKEMLHEAEEILDLLYNHRESLLNEHIQNMAAGAYEKFLKVCEDRAAGCLGRHLKKVRQTSKALSAEMSPEDDFAQRDTLVDGVKPSASQLSQTDKDVSEAIRKAYFVKKRRPQFK